MDVPFQLKKALLGDEVEEGEAARQRHVLVDESERASLRVDEHQLIKDFRAKMSVLQGQLPNFDLRIEDGSYTVLIPDVANDPLYKSSHSLDASRHSSGGGATQNIATIRNTNPLYALGSSLIRCFRGGGDPKIPKKEKQIMSGVNLVFEPGKMYLVL